MRVTAADPIAAHYATSNNLVSSYSAAVLVSSANVSLAGSRQLGDTPFFATKASEEIVWRIFNRHHTFIQRRRLPQLCRARRRANGRPIQKSC